MASIPKANRHSVRGFSLVEVVIGMMILGISCLALYGAIALGFSTLRNARENLLATQIILEKFETIRLYNWDDLNNPTFLPQTFQVVDSVTSGADASRRQTSGRGIFFEGKLSLSDPPFVTNYRQRMKLVTVELRWKSGGAQRLRSLSTLVTFNGLHTFVY